MSIFPAKVKIVEVGPRDGLQNEKTLLSAPVRVELINRLVEAGLKNIEAGSFVNPRWVPQMAGTDEVFAGLEQQPEITYSALVPNIQGYQRAIASGVGEIAVFAAASDSFSLKNINCSVDESIARFLPIMKAAIADKIAVRGYLSCVVGCPYEGSVSPSKVAELTSRLIDMGCYEVSLADTTGVGTPDLISEMLMFITKLVDVSLLAVHCHDTYGNALPNIRAALQLGVAVLDSSVSGLGGCPYAPGSAGNIATEDVVLMLNEMQIMHGVDFDKLVSVSRFIDEKLGRPAR